MTETKTIAAEIAACKCSKFRAFAEGSSTCYCGHVEDDHDFAGDPPRCLVGLDDVDFEEAPASKAEIAKLKKAAKPQRKPGALRPPPRPAKPPRSGSSAKRASVEATS